MKVSALKHAPPSTAAQPKAAVKVDWVQVVQHLRPGGIEALALDLLIDSPAIEQARLLSLEGVKEPAISAWPRLQRLADQLHWLDKLPGLRPAVLFKLVRFFRVHRVQVVHTHHIGPLIYAGLAARLAGVPCLIHTEHDAWHLQSFKRRWLQRVLLWLTRPLLVADARLVADNMVSFLGKRAITVIRNGVDCQRFRSGDRIEARNKLGLPARVKLIGSSGRLEPVKGHTFLINALALMPDDCHLALAGSGSLLTKLIEQAAERGVTKRVHFLGHVEDMPCFYQALDLFCLPSLNEGFPLSALEAQACSIRAAVTDVGASQETLCPVTGLLLKPADPESMAQRLLAALADHPGQDPREFVIRTADLVQTRSAYRALAHSRSPSC